MKKLFYLIIFTSSFAYSQTIDEVYFSKHKLTFFYELENKLNSTIHKEKDRFGVEGNPFDKKERGQFRQRPVKIYKREKIKFPTGLYVYYSRDSQEFANFVMFNWGTFNTSMLPQDEKDAVKKLSSKEKEFRKQYAILYEQLMNKFGNPTEKHRFIDNVNFLSDGATWEQKDIVIKLQLKYPKKFTVNEKGWLNQPADYCVYVEMFYK